MALGSCLPRGTLTYDSGLWLNPTVLSTTSTSCVMLNNILCISHDPGTLLERIQAVFKFKDNKIDQPKIYLGDQVVNMIVYGAEYWYMSE